MKPGKQRRSKAFTLVEFLIVVAVVSLLSIAIIASVNNSTDKAKSTGVMTDIRALETAIHQVGIEQGEFIDDLELLSQQLNKNLDEKLSVHVENNKLVTDATDPWGTEYQLIYSKPVGTLGVLKILSAGQDGSFDTQDDAGIVVSYNKTPNGATINSEEYVYSNDPDNHTCVFNCMVKTSQFVKSVGNCTTPTIYFYSCSCGAVGTETFEGSKNTSTHVSESKYTYEQQNADQHIKVTKCAGCNESITSSSENHSFVVNKCEHCGYEKHVHNYDQQKIEDKYIKTVATCKNAASYYFVCSCGQQGTESYSYGERLQHNYIAEVTKQPTCKAPGIKTHTCSLCGDSYTSELTQYAHSYTQQIVNSSTLRSDSTCTTKATYYYSCSMCNEKGPTDYFESGEVSLTNHDKNASTETKYSKYNETQHLVETICKGCNKTTQSTYANHAFNNVTHTCISCEQHVHEYDQKVTTSKYEKTQATCTQKAVYYYSCVCEAKGTKTFESGDLKAHAFYAQTPDDSEYLKSPATCVAQAVYYRSCTGCGLAGTETFSYGEKNSSNHTGNTKKAYSFKDDDNHTTKTLCSDCNVELKTDTESHEFDNNHTCTLCKNHVHEYNKKDNLRLAQAATCVAKATYYYNCVCNDIGTETYEFGPTNPSNHNDKLIAGATSDCHEKCSECDEITKDGNAHRYQSSIVTNATCTSKGTTQYTCSCGYSYTSQDIPTIAHEPSTTATWSSDHTTVTIQCKNCTKKWSGIASEYETQKATCTVANQYYHTATVNVNGTNKTFDCGVTHTGSNLGHIAGTAATCTTAQICTRDGCGVTLQAQLDHAPATTATWNADHSQASVICTRTNCVQTWNGTATSVNINGATCTTPDTYNHTVTINVNGTNKTFTCDTTHTGSVLGHAPATTCTWNADHTKATVSCTRNECAHTWYSTATENAIDSATCTTPNTYNHKVTINVNGTNKTFTCNTTHSGSALGHKSTNGGTASAHTICSVCNATLSANHTYTVKVTTPATCIAKGINTYTCSCGWIYSEQNVDINSNNHIGYVTTYVSKNDTEHNVNNECSGCHVVKTTTENHNIVDDKCTVCDWERTFYLSGKWFFNEGPGSNTEIVLPNDTYIQNINFTYGTGFTEYSAQNITVTSTGIEYYNQARMYMGMYGKDFGWELRSFIQIDFGTTAQQVSRDFYYWFVDNAEEARLIEGAYQFANELVIPNNDFNQRFEFRLYGFSIPLYALIGEHSHIDSPEFDFEFYLTVDGNLSTPRIYQREDGWRYTPIIIMDSPQYVTDSFYQWFISTTTPYAHTHNFNVKNTNTEYVKTAPTCSVAGTYYYSCECGAKGTETFTGNKLSHTTTNHIDSKHLKKAASCTTDAIYYQSCSVCDENLATTFTDSGSKKGHDYSTKSTTSTYLKSSATCQSPDVYYYKCSRCTSKGTSTYTSGKVNTANHPSIYLVTSCVSISDTQHTTNITCSQCNGVKSSVTSNHNMVDNICEDCGYQVAASYKLAGKWLFNNQISLPSQTIIQIINYSYSRNWNKDDVVDYGNSFCVVDDAIYFDTTEGSIMDAPYSTGLEWQFSNYQYVDFGNTPQAVSQEFYIWFTSNATPYIEGTWLMNETLVPDPHDVTIGFGGFIENVNFIVGGQQATAFDASWHGSLDNLCFDLHYYGYNNGFDEVAYIYEWENEECRYIDFGTELQEVTPEFYLWMLNNATKTYFLSGEWELNYNLIFNNTTSINQNITFYSNETSYQSISIKADSQYSLTYDNEQVCINASATSSSWWMIDTYQVINFGSTPQEVSKEFYEWFVANASQYTSSGYSISGLWKMSIRPGESLLYDIYGNLYQKVNFTSNGIQYTSMEKVITGLNALARISFGETDLYYDSTCVYHEDFGPGPSVENRYWTNNEYQIVDFGSTPQEVSEDFYNWFTSVASQICTIEGIYEFNNNICPDNIDNAVSITQNLNFTSNGQSFSSISLIVQYTSVYLNYDDQIVMCAFYEPVIGGFFGKEIEYWIDANYQTIFITDSQEVSQEFYEWFTANATHQTTKIIEFTLNNTTFQAEEGMTWNEWVNSKYNTSKQEYEIEYFIENYNNGYVPVIFASRQEMESLGVTTVIRSEAFINPSDGRFCTAGIQYFDADGNLVKYPYAGPYPTDAGSYIVMPESAWSTSDYTQIQYSDDIIQADSYIMRYSD